MPSLPPPVDSLGTTAKPFDPRQPTVGLHNSQSGVAHRPLDECLRGKPLVTNPH